jgi:maltooligosyltrehalose synthase
VAFSRPAGSGRVLVVVTRLPAKFPWPPTGEAWTDTRVETGAGPGDWENILEGGHVATGETGGFQLASLFAHLPFAVLVRR